MNNVKVRDI